MKKFLIPIFTSILILSGCGAAENTSAQYSVATDSISYGSGFAYTDGVSEEYIDYDYSESESLIEENGTEEKTYGEKLVYTCNISIETLNYDESLSNIRKQIKEMGGIISKEEERDNDLTWYYSNNTSNTTRNIYIAARIPSDKYSSFVDSINGAGKVISRSSYVENISKQYYNMEAVIESLKIQEERLILMMEQANTIEDMISVESRLTEVQTQLNQYQTSLAAMQMDVDYSTININLEEVKEYTPEIYTTTFFDRLKNTIRESADSFGKTLENLLFFIILIIPKLIIYIPIIILFVFVIRKIVKKIKHTKNKEE